MDGWMTTWGVGNVNVIGLRLIRVIFKIFAMKPVVITVDSKDCTRVRICSTKPSVRDLQFIVSNVYDKELKKCERKVNAEIAQCATYIFNSINNNKHHTDEMYQKMIENGKEQTKIKEHELAMAAAAAVAAVNNQVAATKMTVLSVPLTTYTFEQLLHKADNLYAEAKAAKKFQAKRMLIEMIEMLEMDK